MGLKKSVRQQWEKLLDKNYRKRMQLYLLDYDEWIGDMEQEEAENVQKVPLPSGADPQVVLLSFGGGAWTENAVERMEGFFARHPEVMLAYGDEDMEDGNGGYGSPWLKPCWSPAEI